MLIGHVLILSACRPSPAPPPEAAGGPASEPEAGDARAPTPTPTPVADSPPATFAWRHESALDPGAGRFALVAGGATLRVRPSVRARGLVYDGLHALLVEVIDRRGEFIEVRLDWPERPSAHHCAGARSGAGLGIRLFVAEAELADVTTRPSTVDFGDGGGINVASGVIVAREADGRMKLITNEPTSPQIVTSDHFVATVAPLPLELGKLYVPTLAASLPSPLPREAAGLLRYAGMSLRFATGFAGDHVYAEGPSGALAVGSACLQVAGEYVAQTPEDTWRRPNGGMGCAPPIPYAPAWDLRVGARLTWPEGGDAGEVLHAATVSGKLHRRGSRRCFGLILGCGERSSVQVCADADAITEGKALDLGSTGPVTHRGLDHSPSDPP